MSEQRLVGRADAERIHGEVTADRFPFVTRAGWRGFSGRTRSTRNCRTPIRQMLFTEVGKTRTDCGRFNSPPHVRPVAPSLCPLFHCQLFNVVIKCPLPPSHPQQLCHIITSPPHTQCPFPIISASITLDVQTVCVEEKMETRRPVVITSVSDRLL